MVSRTVYLKIGNSAADPILILRFSAFELIENGILQSSSDVVCIGSCVYHSCCTKTVNFCCLSQMKSCSQARHRQSTESRIHSAICYLFNPFNPMFPDCMIHVSSSSSILDMLCKIRNKAHTVLLNWEYRKQPRVFILV